MIVERFLQWLESAPASQRADATAALCRAYLISSMNDEEAESAEAAMTLLLEDPSPDVRLAMASVFADAEKAPRHIITALAADAPEISQKVLLSSPKFLDVELIDLAATGTVAQQVAIARRQPLAAGVVGALAEVGSERACFVMLQDQNNLCTPRILHRLAERFGTSVYIRNALLKCDRLRPETRLMLVEKLGESLKGLVTSRSWLSAAKADKTVREACDKASIGFAANAEDSDLDRMVTSLIAEGKVTTTFLLRAICMGNITLVSRALSQLSDVPSARVEAMMVNDRRAAFRAVYAKAGMPDKAFDVFHTAISAWRRLLQSKSDISQSRMPYLVTREVLESYHGNENPVIDDLLVLLRKLATETARESARAKVSQMRQSAKVIPMLAAPPMVDIDCIDADEFMEDFGDALEEELALEVHASGTDTVKKVGEVEKVDTEDNVEKVVEILSAGKAEKATPIEAVKPVRLKVSNPVTMAPEEPWHRKSPLWRINHPIPKHQQPMTQSKRPIGFLCCM